MCSGDSRDDVVEKNILVVSAFKCKPILHYCCFKNVIMVVSSLQDSATLRMKQQNECLSTALQLQNPDD